MARKSPSFSFPPAPIHATPLLLLLLLLLLTASTAQGSFNRRILTLHPQAKPKPKPKPSPAVQYPCSHLNENLVTSPFSAQDGMIFVHPSDVVACSHALAPFNREAALQDLDSIIFYMTNFYPLIHIAKNSPEPDVIPSSYDVTAELQGLATATWKYQDDFYAAMAKAVEGLNDGSTYLAYYPAIYSYYWFALPLVGVMEGNSSKVRVAPETMTFKSVSKAALSDQFNNFNASGYSGAQVLSIEDVPAWDYIVAWANQSSPSGFHNLGQRLNDAFARMTHTAWSSSYYSGPAPTFSVGSFAQRRFAPGKDFLKMTLKRLGSNKQETVNVPWIAGIPSPSFPYADALPATTTGGSSSSGSSSGSSSSSSSSSDSTGSTSDSGRGPAWLRRLDRGAHAEAGRAGSFQTKESSGKGSAADNSPQQQGGAGVDAKLVDPVPRGFQLQEDAAQQQDAAGGGTVLSADDDLWPVYKLNDGKTAVVVISTFDIPSYDSSGLTFLQGTYKAFSLANKFSRIIIDLSGNPGGNLVYANWFVQLLVGSKALAARGDGMQQDSQQFLADSKLVKALADYNYSIWDENLYLTINETAFDADHPYFYPIVKKERFGHPGERGKYSSPFRQNIKTVADLVNVSTFAANPFFGSKPVLLLSDGLCYSACHTAANALRLKFGFPLATIGGVPEKPMAFMAGGGGFSTYSIQMATDWLPEELTNQTWSPPFAAPYSPQLAMKVAIGHMNETDRSPMEFTYIPPDFRVFLSYDNITDYAQIYGEAAKFFDS